MTELITFSGIMFLVILGLGFLYLIIHIFYTFQEQAKELKRLRDKQNSFTLEILILKEHLENKQDKRKRVVK